MPVSPDIAAAFSDAVLHQLQSGHRVVLEGIGSLSRIHHPARVEVKDDGTRVLLPPSAVVAFAPASFPVEQSNQGLVSLLAESLGEDAEGIWDRAVKEASQEIAENGSAELLGVGEFSTVDGSLVFETNDALDRNVNAAFAGLVPIGSWAQNEPATEDSDQKDESTVIAAVPLVDLNDDAISDSAPEEVVDEAEIANEVEVDEAVVIPLAELNTSIEDDSHTDPASEPETIDEVDAVEDDSSDTEEPPVDDGPTDEDLDAILAGVWASREAVEDASSDAEVIEEETHKTQHDELAAVAAAAAKATASVVAEDRQPVRPARDESKDWQKFVVPFVLLIAIAATVFLWPRLTSNNTPIEVANTSTPSSLGALDADSTAHAGGQSDSTAIAENDDSSEFASPVEVGDAVQSPDESAPAEVQEAQETPPAPRSANPLRGSGTVNPAQGGFTWVVGSGNEASATRAVAQYRSQGLKASVLSGEANGLTVYRIALGQFSSREEANRFRSQLPAGIPPSSWILPLGAQ